MKKHVWSILIGLFVLALVVGTFATDHSKPMTTEERVTNLASQIRCPTCAGLSVEQSESPLATSAKQEIISEVAAGRTDAQIKAYFVSRYGDSALMSPRRSGVTSLVWILPVIVGLLLVAGVVYAVRRWRAKRVVNEPTFEQRQKVDAALVAANTHTGNVESESDFLFESIRQLDEDHKVGVISDDEYKALRDEQTIRAANILDALLELSDQTPTKTQNKLRKLTTKQWIWAGSCAAFVVIAAGVLTSISSDRLAGENSTGSINADSNTLLVRAQQLTSEGKAADALKTYDAVLKKDPNNVEALTYRGWLVRLAGLSDEGLASIDKAIALKPTYPDAHFFRGFILLRDKVDPKAAIPEFQTFLANNPPQEMVPLVQQALADAQAQAK